MECQAVRLLSSPNPITHICRQIVTETSLVKKAQTTDTAELINPLITNLPPMVIGILTSGLLSCVSRAVHVDYFGLVQRDAAAAINIAEDVPSLVENHTV